MIQQKIIKTTNSDTLAIDIDTIEFTIKMTADFSSLLICEHVDAEVSFTAGYGSQEGIDEALANLNREKAQKIYNWLKEEFETVYEGNIDDVDEVEITLGNVNDA